MEYLVFYEDCRDGRIKVAGFYHLQEALDFYALKSEYCKPLRLERVCVLYPKVKDL